MKTVIWPPTNKEKSISLVKKILEGCLKKLKFWVYDESMGQALMYETVSKGWTGAVVGALHIKRQGFAGLRETTSNNRSS
ncbi:hypothetical protein Hanom_Chr16g01469881 [Helianthus anomalus]